MWLVGGVFTSGEVFRGGVDEEKFASVFAPVHVTNKNVKQCWSQTHP